MTPWGLRYLACMLSSARMTRALARLARRLGVHAYGVFGRALRDIPPPAPAGMTLRVVPEDLMLRHCADPRFELTGDKAKAAYSRGELCIGAFDGPALAGYAWWASAPAPHTQGLWMQFDARSVYIYRAFVRPEYRGLGLAPALYRFADRMFRERGRSQALMCIALDNAASLRAAERSGARLAGYCAYLRAGSLFLQMRGRGAKRAGYRFYLPR